MSNVFAVFVEDGHGAPHEVCACGKPADGILDSVSPAQSQFFSLKADFQTILAKEVAGGTMKREVVLQIKRNSAVLMQKSLRLWSRISAVVRGLTNSFRS